jgi:GntR family transcriptional regulator/MocR family aminotransferase
MITAMLEQLLKLEPRSDVSLQVQLRKKMADAILRGSFPANRPLPSSRKLSQQLHVARNTVILAYEHLEDDGYLIAKERKGYFVNPAILKGSALFEAQKILAKDNVVRSLSPPHWPSVIKSKQSALANIQKPRNWEAYDYPFIYGQIDTSLFPINNWRECCRDSISVNEIRDWASDHVLLDDLMLLDEIRTRILPRRGIWVERDQIMITVGTQQGLYILTKMLLDQSSVMGVEDPGYTDVRHIAALNQATVLPLPVDEHGLVVSDQLSECDCIYVTPSHQSPTTVTLPINRRKELLARAAKDNFMIIEDDYESETSIATEHTPALKSLDKDGRVIYTGSFSKILAPGLRVGYIVASKEIIEEAAALRRLMVRHPSVNNQRSVALFISRGYYDALAAKLLKVYETRWQVMADAMAEHLPESSRPPSFGGSSYWVKGPDHLDARRLKAIARDHSLIIEPGDIHFAGDSPPLNYFRLGYSSIRTDKIEAGIKLLAKLIRESSSE